MGQQSSTPCNDGTIEYYKRRKGQSRRIKQIQCKDHGFTHTATCSPDRTCCSTHVCMYINCPCNATPQSFLEKIPLPRFLLAKIHLDDLLKPEFLYTNDESRKSFVKLFLCETHRRQFLIDLFKLTYQKYGPTGFQWLVDQFTDLLQIDLGVIPNADESTLKYMIDRLNESEKLAKQFGGTYSNPSLGAGNVK